MPSRSTRRNRLNAKKQRRQSRRGGGFCSSDNRCVQLIDGSWIGHCWQMSNNSGQVKCSICNCKRMNIRP